MAGPQTQRQPTFFWQGLLILLPVVVLAAIGGASLRQDKILAETDARERAQSIADDFLQKFSAELRSTGVPTNAAFSFAVDQAGNLVFPPRWNPLPTPQPFNLAELNAEQARWWASLQTAAAGDQKEEAYDQAFDAFMDSNPPENFAAAAAYDQGLRLVQHRKFSEAIEAFGLVVENYPNAVGESGLSLAPLVQLKLMEVQPHSQEPHPQNPSSIPGKRTSQRIRTVRNIVVGPVPAFPIPHFVTLDTFCSNIVYHPTPLSPYLLNCIQEEPQKLEKWRRLWQEHEMARRLYASARGHLVTRTHPAPASFPLASISADGGNSAALNISFPRSFWFTTPGFLFLPKGPGQAAIASQAVYPSYVVVNSAGSNSGSNAIATGPRWVAGDILDRNWLAIAVGDDKTNHGYVCRGETDLGRRITELAAGEKHLPDYFGIGVEVAGKKISAFAPDLHLWTFHYRGGGKAGGGEVRVPLDVLATNVLASAIRSEQLLKVNIYLTSPAKLYQRQRARTFWFSALVAVSATAALIGLLMAWRAFRQQRQLNEMKSNFVSSVSHELRAPIASVRLMAENLEGNKIPEAPKQKEYFGFIVQECRRLSSLIENVLDFSRIEQGRKQYEFEPTDVVALVQTTVKLMEPNAAEKGVILKAGTSNIEHRTPNIELEIDGRAMQQALVNLIDNAIKHSPKGETVTVGLEVRNAECGLPSEASGRRMGVRSESGTLVEDEGRERGRGRTDTTLNPQPPGASKRSEGGSTLNLFVSDHGPGIPAAEQAKIFERFYRRGSELRRETQGVGIGLSIVKHIVEAHGGRVRVESRVGQGSRFTIELPMKNETSNIER